MASVNLLAQACNAVSALGQKLRHPDLNLSDFLGLADKMLQELRTNDLTPKQYYELNLLVVEQLSFCQTWFQNQQDQVPLVELYQRVQYTTNALPRLYLMLTVGAVYIRTPGSSAKEVMRDMLEMCKSVQHPIRGLFLRNYLVQHVIRDKLSLLGSDYDQAEFLLQNTKEMCWLWSRMMKKEEEGAKALGQLVGQNFSRLSEFSLPLYLELIATRLMNMVVHASDVGDCQTFLFDYWIHAFSTSYLFAGLDTFLLEVKPVNSQTVKETVLCGLLIRLVGEEEGDTRGDHFDAVFGSFLRHLQENALCRVLIQLLRLCQSVEQRVQVLDVLASSSSNSREEIVDVLKLCFTQDQVRMIQLPSVFLLFKQLDKELQHVVASNIILFQMVHSSSVVIDSLALCTSVFQFVPKDALLIAQLVFRFQSQNTEEMLAMCGLVKEKLGEGNLEEEENEASKLALLLPLVYKYMEISRRCQHNDGQQRVVLQTVFSLLTTFAEGGITSLTRPKVIGLFTTLALQADEFESEEAVSYECMVSALSLFEEEADSKLRTALMPSLLNSVICLKHFSKENLEILQTKVALYAAQLLKKRDQAHFLGLSAHLFFNQTNSKNGKRALECLQRAGKTASKDLGIQVELLTHYIYFFDAGADKIKASHLFELLQHIRQLHESSETSLSLEAEGFYRRTLLHIQALAKEGGKFVELSLA